MATKRLKRPRDPIALAKLIGDIATGQVTDEISESPAATSGRSGGLVRARKLSASERASIAKKAAQSRWRKGRAARGKKEPV